MLANPSSVRLRRKFSELRAKLQRQLREMENNWWTARAAEIQLHADNKDAHAFYDAIKAIYGPQRNHIAPILASDGVTLCKTKDSIMKRWAEHYHSVLNRQSDASPESLDTLPDLPTVDVLDEPPAFHEVTSAIRSLKNRVPGLMAYLLRSSSMVGTS